MRFLLDTNLPAALAREMRRIGIDAQHVETLGLNRHTDPVVWRFACLEKWIVVTKDTDFFNLQTSGEPGAGKILWLRCGNCRKATLYALVLPSILDIATRFAAGADLIEIR